MKIYNTKELLKGLKEKFDWDYKDSGEGYDGFSAQLAIETPQDLTLGDEIKGKLGSNEFRSADIALKVPNGIRGIGYDAIAVITKGEDGKKNAIIMMAKKITNEHTTNN